MKTTIGELRQVIREAFGDGDADEESPQERASRWAAIMEQPDNKPFIDAIKAAKDPKELARAKRALVKADDAGTISMRPGMWMSVYDERKQELADMNHKPMSPDEFRKDCILRTRDSSGKATARKWK